MTANSGDLQRLLGELSQAVGERDATVAEFVRQLRESQTHLIRPELLARIEHLDARVHHVLGEMLKARLA